MEYIRNNMAARATDLRLYLDYNPDMATFNKVRLSRIYISKAEADDLSSTPTPTTLPS